MDTVDRIYPSSGVTETLRGWLVILSDYDDKQVFESIEDAAAFLIQETKDWIRSQYPNSDLDLETLRVIKDPSSAYTLWVINADESVLEQYRYEYADLHHRRLT